MTADDWLISPPAFLQAGSSYRVRFKYQLVGYDAGWVDAGALRTAYYTRLPPGSYLFRVIACNNDGVWNEEGAALRLVVIPPWWRTRWAYGSYVFLALGMLYGLRRVEIKRREQKALIRESNLRAKAAEAEKRALQAENDRKTKELIAIGVSLVAKCEGCLEGHLKKAKELGLKKVEVGITPASGTVTWRIATGTASWSYNWTLPDDGDYTIQSRATNDCDTVEAPGQGVIGSCGFKWWDRRNAVAEIAYELRE